jgi:hypothetical protein
VGVRDQIFGYVGGTVERVFSTDKGSHAKIAVQGERDKYPTRVTVWGVGGDVREGDRVTVKGFISVKARSYTKQDGTTGYAADISVNGGVVEERETAGAVQVPADWAVVDTNESAPF